MNQSEAVHHLCLDDVPNCSAVDQLTLELITDEEVNLAQLAGIIEENPGLAGLVIGLANSAYFGSSSSIVNVRDAIIKVLGIGLVRSLVLSVILGRSLDLSRCPAFSVAGYWTRSLATARFAQTLARSSPLTDTWSPDQVYLCGLLSNFGQLLLVHHYPAQMNRVLGMQVTGPAILAEQRAALGMHQGDAGGLIGRHWQLPACVTDTMQYCHREDYEGEHAPLCRVVGFVDEVLGTGPDVSTPDVPESVCRMLARSGDDIAEEFATLPQIYGDLQRVAGYLERGA